MKKRSDSKNVIWLGIVSLLTDISSEMIFPIIPLFLTIVLKANMAVIGVLLVTALLFYFGDAESGMRTVFWLSCIPAGIAVLCLYLFVHDVKKEKKEKNTVKKQKPFHTFKAWKKLNSNLKKFYVIMLLFHNRENIKKIWTSA